MRALRHVLKRAGHFPAPRADSCLLTQCRHASLANSSFSRRGAGPGATDYPVCPPENWMIPPNTVAGVANVL